MSYHSCDGLAGLRTFMVLPGRREMVVSFPSAPSKLGRSRADLLSDFVKPKYGPLLELRTALRFYEVRSRSARSLPGMPEWLGTRLGKWQEQSDRAADQ